MNSGGLAIFLSFFSFEEDILLRQIGSTRLGEGERREDELFLNWQLG